MRAWQLSSCHITGFTPAVTLQVMGVGLQGLMAPMFSHWSEASDCSTPGLYVPGCSGCRQVLAFSASPTFECRSQLTLKLGRAALRRLAAKTLLCLTSVEPDARTPRAPASSSETLSEGADERGPHGTSPAHPAPGRQTQGPATRGGGGRRGGGMRGSGLARQVTGRHACRIRG